MGSLMKDLDDRAEQIRKEAAKRMEEEKLKEAQMKLKAQQDKDKHDLN